MAQQIIDTGAAANDGTGEPLRDAFTAVNENFTEIYTAGPVGSNVVISGNTITVTGVNNNLVLRANGIGNIQANSTIMPSIDAVYDIGAPTQRVDTVYAQYFVGNGSGITGVSHTLFRYTCNIRSLTSLVQIVYYYQYAVFRTHGPYGSYVNQHNVTQGYPSLELYHQ